MIEKLFGTINVYDENESVTYTVRIYVDEDEIIIDESDLPPDLIEKLLKYPKDDIIKAIIEDRTIKLS